MRAHRHRLGTKRNRQPPCGAATDALSPPFCGLRERIGSAGNPRLGLPAQIVTQALERSDDRCRAAVEVLVRLLARVAGDLFLAFLPLGGVYLSGGVTRACAPLIASGLFWEEFTRKGRQTDLLCSVPIHIINDDNAALAGCLSAMTAPARTRCA